MTGFDCISSILIETMQWINVDVNKFNRSKCELRWFHNNWVTTNVQEISAETLRFTICSTTLHNKKVVTVFEKINYKFDSLLHWKMIFEKLHGAISGVFGLQLVTASKFTTSVWALSLSGP